MHRIRAGVPAGGRVRALTAVMLVACAAAGAAGLAACGSSDNGGSSGATSPASPPAGGSFSGSGPSALDSLASSAKSAASSAASSAAAAASSFASSVAARTTADAAAASAELAKVKGQGNAAQDVQLVGLPKADSGGLHAVVVTITNHSSAKASFAVKVEFADSDGKVADSTVVGAPDVEPGKKATPIAFSTKDKDTTLFPRVAQAQGY